MVVITTAQPTAHDYTADNKDKGATSVFFKKPKVTTKTPVQVKKEQIAAATFVKIQQSANPAMEKRLLSARKRADKKKEVKERVQQEAIADLAEKKSKTLAEARADFKAMNTAAKLACLEKFAPAKETKKRAGTAGAESVAKSSKLNESDTGDSDFSTMSLLRTDLEDETDDDVDKVKSVLIVNDSI